MHAYSVFVKGCIAVYVSLFTFICFPWKSPWLSPRWWETWCHDAPVTYYRKITSIQLDHLGCSHFLVVKNFGIKQSVWNLWVLCTFRTKCYWWQFQLLLGSHFSFPSWENHYYYILAYLSNSFKNNFSTKYMLDMFHLCFPKIMSCDQFSLSYLQGLATYS